MRSVFLISLFFLISTLSAQEKSIIDSSKTYEFKHGAEVTPCKVDGTPLKAGQAVVLKKGWDVHIEQILDKSDKIIFTVPEWDDSKLKTRNDQYAVENINGKKQDRYYYLTIDEFKKHLKVAKAYVEVEFGTAVIPIKIRPKGDDRPFDFSGNFNAGVGVYFKLRGFVNIYSGISLTSVPIDSLTTRGFITTSTNAAALTPTFGLVKDFDKFQVGGFVGFDYLSRELGNNFVYQGRPWYGIGISANIFTISSGKREEESQ